MKYRRGQLIEAANKKGYDIKNNDVSWCTNMGLINPAEFTKAMFLYDEEDLHWLEKLGQLKQAGLEKSIVEKIFTSGTIHLVNEMIEKATFEKDMRGGVI